MLLLGETSDDGWFTFRWFPHGNDRVYVQARIPPGENVQGFGRRWDETMTERRYVRVSYTVTVQ